jgi:hypothetical protein
MTHRNKVPRVFAIAVLALAAVFGATAILVNAQPAASPPRVVKPPSDKVRGPHVQLPVPDLRPSLNVGPPGSCGSDQINSRLAAATPPQFYIKGLYVVVYNNGSAASNAGATGTATFRDYRTNTNKRFTFTVGALDPKKSGAGIPTPLSSDEFYVSTTDGIRLTVSYTGGALGSPATHETTTKACPRLL